MPQVRARARAQAGRVVHDRHDRAVMDALTRYDINRTLFAAGRVLTTPDVVSTNEAHEVITRALRMGRRA